MTKEISKTLGLSDLDDKVIDVYVPCAAKPKFNKDNEKAKDAIYELDKDETINNVKDIIEIGKDSINELFEIARSTGEPKAFQALSTLINTYVNSNETLLKLHNEHRKRKDKGDRPKDTPTSVTTHNNLIVSTNELLEIINKNKGESNEN